MGGSVEVTGLSKTYGRQNIWDDVTITFPPGEITALLGPSGTGKSVFLKSLMGIVEPERGEILIDGVDMVTAKESLRLQLRKKFGVLFQDGALFGSMNVYDNVAFPLREHTRKDEDEIRQIVLDKLDMVGLLGTEHKLPGEISGGMKKRAGLARSLVTDPDIILIDEPDSGLDPVRTSNLAQLLVEVNAETDATMLVVTHNIELARTMPDNLGMLYRRELVMFGPREEFLLTDHPVVSQFMSGDPEGPIGMSEETDHRSADLWEGPLTLPNGATAATIASRHAGARAIEVLPRQLEPKSGVSRPAAQRHRERVTSGGAPLYVADDDERERVPSVRRPGPATRALTSTGDVFALALDTARFTFRRPFSWREALEQFWFVVSVSWVPAILVAIPFGAVIALQLGTLTVQVGAQSFTGAASVLAVVQQAAPIVTSLVIAGAGGAAICADLGSRAIRDEIDAMKVMGVSPIQRLVVPRVLACIGAAVLLNGLVSVVGVLGGYFFNVIVQGGTPGAYLASFTALAQISDLWVGELKAVLFGFIAGVIACHRGLNTAPGPKGVGDSVNQSVVVTFLLLFFVNFVITTLYLQLVPGKEPDMAKEPFVPEVREPRVWDKPVDVAASAGSELRFHGRVLAWVPATITRYPKDVLRLLSEVSFGSGALAVIGGTVGVMLGMTLFVGSVVGLQGYAALDQIGTSTLNGFISAYFNTREIAPLVAALALSATVGSGFTAQLGAMRINEEVDALTVMAVPSVPYLVTTRVVAGFVAIIPLYVIGLLTSYFGSRFVTTVFYGQSAGTYDHYFNLFLPPIDILLSFLKVLIFAVIIILIHCYLGFTAKGGPAGVGIAVGTAVRRSIVTVAVLDLVLSLALWGSNTTVRIAG